MTTWISFVLKIARQSTISQAWIRRNRRPCRGDDRLVYGFATIAPAHDEDLPGQGELCALYVDPKHWGRGIGLALLAAARTQLFELGYRRALLWVLMGNVRAEYFYRSDGWFPDGVQRPASVWGINVEEMRYRRSLEKP
jgi:GNAT superfamily N-acetyltransferase